MMGVDLDLYGNPKSDHDVRRQLVRDFDRVAMVLEVLQHQLGQLRIDVTAPFTMGRPDLVPDLNKADVAVMKLLAWACSAAKAASKPAESEVV